MQYRSYGTFYYAYLYELQLELFHINLLYFQAAKKGVSKTVIGLIFSTFEFVIFLSSPVFGTFVSIMANN